MAAWATAFWIFDVIRNSSNVRQSCFVSLLGPFLDGFLLKCVNNVSNRTVTANRANWCSNGIELVMRRAMVTAWACTSDKVFRDISFLNSVVKNGEFSLW